MIAKYTRTSDGTPVLNLLMTFAIYILSGILRKAQSVFDEVVDGFGQVRFWAFVL